MYLKVTTVAAILLLGACATTQSGENVAATSATASQVQTSDAAEGAAPVAQTASADGQLDPDKVICKNLRITGSRIARRKICKTRKEWEREAAATRQGADQFINRAGGVNTDRAQ
ncbi:MAG: hypothetical protein AAGA09_03545 [Pseudomonadota bacterium]